MAYTYLIGWSQFNIWYYGSRDPKGAPPIDDLWKKYFTSSKYVKQKRKSYGEPDVIQVRKTFANYLEAKQWETKVIKRIGAVSSPSWLNQTDHTDKFYHVGKRGPQSAEHKKKLSEAAKNRKVPARLGKPFSEEGKRKLREAWVKRKQKFTNVWIGRSHTEEAKLKMSLAKLGTTSWNKGISPSVETRKKLSEYMKSNPRLHDSKGRFV